MTTHFITSIDSDDNGVDITCSCGQTIFSMLGLEINAHYGLGGFAPANPPATVQWILHYPVQLRVVDGSVVVVRCCCGYLTPDAVPDPAAQYAQHLIASLPGGE